MRMGGAVFYDEEFISERYKYSLKEVQMHLFDHFIHGLFTLKGHELLTSTTTLMRINMKRSIKRLTMVVLLACFAVGLKAQQSFSLEEAIQYALINNENLKNAKLNIEDADAQVGETASKVYQN